MTLGRAGRSWTAALVGIVGLGIALRVVYVVVVLGDLPPGFDAAWYTLQGGAIRDGLGYVVPTSMFDPPLLSTANFPPAYPTYLALWQMVFDDGPTSVRLAGVVPAVVTIVATALVARRLAGGRAALIAAFVVAVDPMLVAADGSTMSENLSVALVALAVLAALYALDRRLTWASLIPLALLGGVAVLTRQDLALLTVVLFGVVLVLAPASGRGLRVAAGTAGVTVVASVVLPWAIRNQRAVDTFAISTLSAATALAGANCDQTYRGPAIGQWEYDCVSAALDPTLSEAEQTSRLQSRAFAYLRDHPARLVVVVPARVLRVWGFWDPRDQIPREVVESRREGWQQVTWVTNLAFVALGACGLRRLARLDRRAAYVVAAPVACVIVVAAATHGNTRFSAIAHPALVVGIAIVASGWRARRAAAPTATPVFAPEPARRSAPSTGAPPVLGAKGEACGLS